METKLRHFTEMIRENLGKFLLVLLILLLFHAMTPVFLVILFISLDYLTSVVKNRIGFKLIPFDFNLVGMLLVGIIYPPSAALAFPIAKIVKRMLLSRINRIHLVKIPLLFLILYLTSLLRGVHGLFLGMAMVLLRYLFELFLNLFVLGDFDSRRLAEIVYHAFANTLLFSMLYGYFK